MSACSSSSRPSSRPPTTICYLLSLPDLRCDRLRSVFLAGPPRRSFALSVPGQTYLRSVFLARPQPRPFAICVPCRTSAIVCAQCSLPDFHRDRLRSVFLAGPPRSSALGVPEQPFALGVPCRTSTDRKDVRQNARKNVRKYVKKNARRYVRKNVKIC